MCKNTMSIVKFTYFFPFYVFKCFFMVSLVSSVAKAALALLALLYSPPEHLDYRHAPPRLAKNTLQTENSL